MRVTIFINSFSSSRCGGFSFIPFRILLKANANFLLIEPNIESNLRGIETPFVNEVSSTKEIGTVRPLVNDYWLSSDNNLSNV